MSITFKILNLLLFLIFLTGCSRSEKVNFIKSDSIIPEVIDFNFHVRPILSDRCFACHGPDENSRKADLRLDQKNGIFTKTKEGIIPVVVGHPDSSAVIERILSSDPEMMMPPPESNLKLSEYEKNILIRWVEQGAKWEKHWAYIPPEKVKIPELKELSWGENEIDYFVSEKLNNLNLKPSPMAAPKTLLRRVSLDLTGLPPDPIEIDSFINTYPNNYYEIWVDKLLDSPNFGERWAWEWLDVARYADTNGFQADPTRTMWPWRDWVIEAFNSNMPYDEFTIKQIAGDLLPEASINDILATGFNRNHTYNGEGGRIPEETRVENVFDRVETVGTTWLGLTFNCARCHDHKYDALSQREYYQMYDYFNQTSEPGNVYGSGQVRPVLDVSSNYSEEYLKKLDMKPVVMVMDETENPRQSHILIRGGYNSPSHPVERNVPSFLPPLKIEGETNNRLTIAKWIVSEDNPLTARVTVNRYWQAFFGKGLVKTIEDFGAQGDLPTHPDLLDWLAVDFQQNGWDIKRLFKKIVTSATYKQSSRISQELLQLDPENKYLARFTRRRMPSWMIRDQALQISGLLVDSIGGEPVNPYQPEGVWEEATFGMIKYVQDHGQDLYRRTIYTFWRRISGPTILFDNANRQVCTVESVRTNTPLHALTTLNDVTYTEAARVMAEKILKEFKDENARISMAFKLATARDPRSEEIDIISERLEKLRKQFQEDNESARKIISAGEYPVNEQLDLVNYASFSLICSLLLNLDETLNVQ